MEQTRLHTAEMEKPGLHRLQEILCLQLTVSFLRLGVCYRMFLIVPQFATL